MSSSASSLKAQPPSFSAPEFRAALGMFATGVTIVTARTADGGLIGLTANSFNSVSIDPPLVLWSLARAAASLPAFSTGSHYAINILGADQHELAKRQQSGFGAVLSFEVKGGKDGAVKSCAGCNGKGMRTTMTMVGPGMYS